MSEGLLIGITSLALDVALFVQGNTMSPSGIEYGSICSWKRTQELEGQKHLYWLSYPTSWGSKREWESSYAVSHLHLRQYPWRVSWAFWSPLSLPSIHHNIQGHKRVPNDGKIWIHHTILQGLFAIWDFSRHNDHQFEVTFVMAHRITSCYFG